MPKAASQKVRFVVCVVSDGVSASLEPRKIYQVVPPLGTDPKSMVRIIDESGEDYLYPRKWFVGLRLPPRAKSIP